MLKIFKYLKPFTLLVVLLVILVFTQSMVNLSLPDYMSRIVNDGIVSGNNSAIYHNGAVMLLLSLGGGVAAVIAGYLASIVATGLARNMREKVFTKVENFSLVEFNKFYTASLITRSTNDIQQIQQVMSLLLRMAVLAPFTGIGAIIKAYQTAPSMTWLMAVSIGALVLLIIILFSVTLPKFQVLQKLVDRLNLVTREILTGLRVIRAFNNEKYEEKKFDKANIDLTDTNLFVNRMMVVLMPLMTLIMSGTMLAILWIGAGYIGAGTVNIGNVMAFMQYSTQAVFSFLMISMVFVLVPRASVAGYRVAEVIETEPVIKDPAQSAVSVKDSKLGRVEFIDVDFRYGSADDAVLQNITFVAEPHKTTAIVGSTGSGKSTLINLVPRFYDATKGEVKVDGIDVRDYSQEDLRGKIGYVPQKGVLFSGTVKSNIKYGAPEATDKEVAYVAKVAQADDFIAKLPEKYDSPISQGGANVSGGQKQRLAIARALITKPEILIFDDSFSALDFKTDAMLRESLRQDVKSTVIIVAQRISTVLEADKIIVLDEGKIVGQGTHAELMKECDVYKEIALSQLTEKEIHNYEKQVSQLKTAGKTS